MDSKELRLFREAYNSINTPQTEQIQEETVAEEQLDEMDIVGKLRSGLNKIGIKGTSPALEREKAADKESRRLGGNRMRQAEGDNTRPTPMKDDVDLFDIVKGHLVSEGLTEEEAIQKMVTMTEEERNAIAEQYTINVADVKGGTQAAKNAAAGMKDKKGNPMYKPGVGVTPDFKLKGV